MALYRMHERGLALVGVGRFADDDIREREDLQRMLRDAIDIVAPGAMVLAEEFSDWEDSRRRIDLLGLDEDANLVAVELKRTADGGHMDLQSIRYAAMVSGMTYSRAVAAHGRHLANSSQEGEAEERILDFLGWDEPDEEAFGRDVRIVLVSADFSTEITTAVLWLIDRGVDIRCVRMSPYKLDDQMLVSVEQVIPLPLAEAYQVRLREKSIGARAARHERGRFTGYWFVNIGEHGGPQNHRSWNDCRRYGFISAGGKSVRQIAELRSGDRVLAYRKGHGYVGAGIVTAVATPWEEFAVGGTPITELSLEGSDHTLTGDRAMREHCIGVRWLKTLDREQSVKAAFRRPTACRINDGALVEQILAGLGLSEADFAE